MSSPRFSTRKISETIIDFAWPVLVHVDATTPQETTRQIFHVAVTIWNAFVMDRVNGNTALQDMIRKQVGVHSEADAVVHVLMKRRMEHFADDMRFVAEHHVSFDANGYKLRAAAKDPYLSAKK